MSEKKVGLSTVALVNSDMIDRKIKVIDRTKEGLLENKKGWSVSWKKFKSNFCIKYFK